MSYFQYTKRDLAEQRAAGIEEAKKEIGETLAGLADDSSRKLDSELTDRQIILEDLITRLCMIAGEFAPGSIDLFESLANFRTPPIMEIVPVPAARQDDTVDLTEVRLVLVSNQDLPEWTED